MVEVRGKGLDSALDGFRAAAVVGELWASCLLQDSHLTAQRPSYTLNSNP